MEWPPATQAAGFRSPAETCLSQGALLADAENSEAKFLFPDWVLYCSCCRTGPPGYKGWREGATTLGQSRLYPPSQGLRIWLLVKFRFSIKISLRTYLYEWQMENLQNRRKIRQISKFCFRFPDFYLFLFYVAGTLDCWGAAGRAAWWRRRGCRLTRRLAYRASAPRWPAWSSSRGACATSPRRPSSRFHFHLIFLVLDLKNLLGQWKQMFCCYGNIT
jgi:hypothetical protein